MTATIYEVLGDLRAQALDEREVGDPRYILDLLARVTTVSVETNKIVDRLPPLDIVEGG